MFKKSSSKNLQLISGVKHVCNDTTDMLLLLPVALFIFVANVSGCCGKGASDDDFRYAQNKVKRMTLERVC